VNRFFADGAKRDGVLHSFSGVRPLFDDKVEDASAVTRDYALELDAHSGAAPLVSIFGGKITTYRRLAEHVLERLAPFFPGMKGRWTEGPPLPGGDLGAPDFAAFLIAARRRYPWLPEPIAYAYARRYGSRMHELLDGAASLGDLGRPFGGGLLEREARFLVTQEWARTAEDILERRTKHHLRMTAGERTEFESWFDSSVGPGR
jgi:glycerol-3-phosphate dehydrogenase